MTLSAGESFSLIASGGDGTKYSFESDDPGVASVDDAGKVTAIAAGTANITVASGGKSAECIVRVKGTSGTTSGETQTTASNASLNKTDITLAVGESFTLAVAGGTASSWATDSAAIASVDGSGRVRAVGSGKTNVTATLEGGKKLECIVRVK